mgnify:CR=1 FL=1
MDFGTDDGSPCGDCGGTVYRYRATASGTAFKVSADCVGCGARYPVAFELRRDIRLTAAVLSDAHRRHWEWARKRAS